MKRTCVWFTRTAVCMAAAAVALPVVGQSADEIAKIEAAMPAKARVKPQKPRRVLVYSLALGFKHDSIPYGEKAFEIMGKKTGAFEVEVTSDTAAISKENLARFDAILMNNTTGEVFPTAAEQEALTEFVRSGKGLAGVHAATDTAFAWTTFGDMIGGYFDLHPWTADTTVTIKIDEPEHPVVAVFGGEPFVVQDEIYQMKAPYSRRINRVLMSLDTDKTDMTKPGIKRQDKDFGISWVKREGKGRVFYSSLGHNKHIYWNEKVLQHYLDGIQYALGDLKANDKPNEKASATSNAALDKALAEMQQYDFGQSRAFLIEIDQAIRDFHGNNKERERLADRLAELAESTTASFAARDLAFRRLGDMQARNQIPRIAKGLSDPDKRIADMARMTLETIGSNRAENVLVRALKDAEGDVKIGIIQSLGVLQADGVAGELATLAKSDDTSVSLAAITALGAIGKPGAANRLLQLEAGADKQAVWGAALIDCGAALEKSNPKLAARLYEAAIKLPKESAARLAGWTGLARISGEPELAAARELVEGDPSLESAARKVLAQGTNAAANEYIVSKLASSAPEKQVVLAELLGLRGAKSAVPALLELSKSDEDAVQQGAVLALGLTGGGEIVELLLELAAGSTGALRKAATDSIASLKSSDADTRLMRVVRESPDPKRQVAAIEAVKLRKSPDSVPALLEVVKGDDAKAAAEAFGAMGELAKKEDFAKVLEAHLAVTTGSVLKESEKAVTSVGRLGDAQAAASDVVDAANGAAEKPEMLASLVRIAGKLGGAKALEMVRNFLNDERAEIKDAAVRALVEFPSVEAIDDAVKIARESDNQVHKVLALRGVARMLGLNPKKSAEDIRALAAEALTLAQSADDKRTVIGSLGDVNQPGIIALLVPMVENEEVRGEAVSAIVKVAVGAAVMEPDVVESALKVVEPHLNSTQKKDVDKVRKQLEDAKDYVPGWMVSGPHQADKGATLEQVMGQAFEPETNTTGTADWKYIASDGGKKTPELVNLAKELGKASKAAAYLKAYVYSPGATSATLGLGSDDGVRAWVNGEQVFSFDGSRRYTTDSDKVPVSLQAGWNSVMLKVGQDDTHWAAGARITGSDDKALEGAKFRVTEPAPGQ